MEYRRLGRSGLQVSCLSFGSWVTFHNQLEKEKAKNLLAMAYEAGVNFFDNAETYASGKSEEIMGQAIHELGWSRDSYIVSSKVFWGGDLPTQRGLSKKHVVDACNAALRRLKCDYLDLYFCHRPDENTPIEETVRTMHELIQQGKVLYWGTSEWSAEQIMQAYSVAREYHLTPPTMEQPQYNMLHRHRVEGEYRRLYSEIGLGTTIWSPLASGLLTGKYNDGIPEGSRLQLPGYEWLRKKLEGETGQEQLQKVRKLSQLCKDWQIELTNLAIAWCLKNPQVSTVILGASKTEQLEQNLKSLSLVPCLTDEMMQQLDAILQNKPEAEIFS